MPAHVANKVLMAIDGKALVSTDEIWAALHASTRGSVLSYSVLRLQGSPQLVNIAVDQTPSGARGLYFALAVVGHELAVLPLLN